MTDDSKIGEAWSLPGVLGYFDTERSSTAQVYASEWIFLKDRLKEGMSVLDVGCAQGGFAAMLAENLKDFSYTGLDVSSDMITRARVRFPRHSFHHVVGGDWGALGAARFDQVLVLGILHLHFGWRDTIAQAWARTKSCLILDLREIDGPTVEDQSRSYFKMDFGASDDRHAATTLPYVLVNAAEALATIRALCPDAARISHYGYLHPVSSSAVTPVGQAMANVWCIER
ncbi:putative methyltransferase (Methylase) [Candidatus Terasakiella magnetica]|nr:putative methyltransferase (Methylase) [Candidatus Terasakiella magnetica]